VRGISVLLVDGSVVVRRLLTEALGGDSRVRTVTTAANIDIALAKVPQVNPDVVVVDLDLPESDPFATVRALRKSYPDLPVVVDSERTHRGADISLRALEAGATRCVSRPSGIAGQQLAARVRKSLVPVLLEVAEAAAGDPVPSVLWQPEVSARAVPRRAGDRPPEVLALGASTGGPDALERVLAGLPASFPLPILVVQHMPAGFTTQFARRLTSRCELEVREARNGDVVQVGRVLLAPGGFHMRVRTGSRATTVGLDKGTPENFCRPSVDVLFRSVASTYGAASLAVVLTGMGADGLRGARELVEVGAEVLTQDQASSAVWGMPGAVSQAGLSSEVLGLDEVVPAILRRLRPLRTGKGARS
jgi:two-component system chemotaxis response regulator CheB